MLRRTIAWVEVIVGFGGMLLIAAAYTIHAGTISDGLLRLDRLSETAESQLGGTRNMLGEVNHVVGKAQELSETHKATIVSARESAERFSETIQLWEGDLHSLAEIAQDAGNIGEAIESQLPIRIPEVEIITKEIEYPIPAMTLVSQEFEIEYPQATVATREEKIKIDLGPLEREFTITLPSGVTVDNMKKKLTVENIPEYDIAIDSAVVPERFVIEHREIMADEKEVAGDCVEQLRQSSVSLVETANLFANLRSSIDTDLMVSLTDTERCLGGTSSLLESLHDEHIPRAMQDLSEIETTLHTSNRDFSSLNSLVTISFIVAGIIPFAILCNGLNRMKYFRDTPIGKS